MDCLESTFKLRFGKVRLVQGDWFLEGSVQEVGLGLVSNNVEIKRFPRGRELDAFYNQLIHLSLFGIKVKIIIPRNKIAKLEEFLAENGKNSLLMMT